MSDVPEKPAKKALPRKLSVPPFKRTEGAAIPNAGRPSYPAEVRRTARQQLDEDAVRRLGKIAKGKPAKRGGTLPTYNEQIRAFETLARVGLTTSENVTVDDMDFVQDLIRVAFRHLPEASHRVFMAELEEACKGRVLLGDNDQRTP